MGLQAHLKGWLNSFAGRLFLFAAFLVISAGFLLYLFFYAEFKDFYYFSRKDSLLKECRLISPFVKRILLEGGSLQGWIRKMGEASGIRITVIAPGGKVLADSQHDPATMDNHWNRPEVQQCLKKGVGSSVRYSITLNRYLMYVAVPLYQDRKLLGVLRLSYHLSSLQKPLSRLKGRLFLTLLLLLVASLAVAYFATRSLVKDVGLFVEASGRIARGDFGFPIPVPRVRELKNLAESLRNMRDSLRESFSRLVEERMWLEELISFIPDPVVLLDVEDRIVFANAAFVRHFAKGGTIWEVVRSPELVDVISSARDSGKAWGEVEVGERIYEVSAVKVPFNGKVLLVMRDVTRKKRLEQMKTEFVANVSHELKTPLTVVKGYAEMLLESEESPQNREYLKIIVKHAERMARIVEDLLLLSSLEEGYVGERQEVDLKEVVKEVCRRMAPLAEGKGLEMKVSVPDTPVVVEGIPHLLEQLLENLLSNAVNYTEKGSVEVVLERRGDEAKLVVKDTGVGIPKEHLPRIFERFYRVDKSRSRATGGTGLGLSIVKHIVKLHKGYIYVESEPQRGTTFTVVFPCRA